MTVSDNDRYADLFTDGMSEARSRLVHDLEVAYRPAPAPQLDATVLPALAGRGPYLRKAAWAHLPGRSRPRKSRWARPQPAALVAAFALVLAGVLAYLHGQTPAPVSAQAILSRVATAGLTPNQATHFTYQLTASNGFSGRSDEWVEADANGMARQVALSNTVLDGQTPVTKLDLRLIQTGDTVQVYDPAADTVTVAPEDQLDQPWESIIIGTRVAQKLSGAAPDGPTSQAAHKQAAQSPSQQTLNGVPVYVLSLSPNGNETFYVDAQSYVPRGADWTQNGVTWNARLLRYDSMPLSSVPAATFTLHAPATAKEIQAQPDKSDYPVDFSEAFAQVCKTSPSGFKAALGSDPNQSFLTACQQTSPAVTSAQLEGALVAAARAQLDAAVAAGQITAAQAADELARIEATISGTVNSSGDAPKATPAK